MSLLLLLLLLFKPLKSRICSGHIAPNLCLLKPYCTKVLSARAILHPCHVCRACAAPKIPSNRIAATCLPVAVSSYTKFHYCIDEQTSIATQDASPKEEKTKEDTTRIAATYWSMAVCPYTTRHQYTKEPTCTTTQDDSSRVNKARLLLSTE